MGRIRAWGFVVAGGLILASLGVVAGQEPAPSEVPADAASIREGDCEPPGDVIALLDELALAPAAGPIAGPSAEPPLPVRSSITDVTFPLEQLLEDGPSVVVEDTTSGDIRACARIAGTIVDDGLALALEGADGELQGIVWLRALGQDATTVHVFTAHPDIGLAGPRPGDGSPRPGDPSPPPADPSPRPDGPSPSPGGPSPSPGGPSPAPGGSPQPGGGGLEPDPDIDPGEDIDVDVGA